MNRFEELEFALRIPDTTKVAGGNYQLSCPYCREGSSFGRKKRGYILMGNSKVDRIVYMCHRCGVRVGLNKLLEDHYPGIYSDYARKNKTIWLEKLKNGEIKKKRALPAEIDEYTNDIQYIQLDKEMVPVKTNVNALRYLQKRKVPHDTIDTTYYMPNAPKTPYNDCIIFPFYNGKKVYGFQARSYKDKYFHTVVEEGQKIYNLYNVNLSEDVYIFESLLDSLYTPNSIACLGSDIADHHLQKIKKPIFVFDNDRVGKSKAIKMSKRGYRVVTFPPSFKFKDINEAVVSGLTSNNILDIIRHNIWSGWQAKLRLTLRHVR